MSSKNSIWSPRYVSWTTSSGGSGSTGFGAALGTLTGVIHALPQNPFQTCPIGTPTGNRGGTAGCCMCGGNVPRGAAGGPKNRHGSIGSTGGTGAVHCPGIASLARRWALSLCRAIRCTCASIRARIPATLIASKSWGRGINLAAFLFCTLAIEE